MKRNNALEQLRQLKEKQLNNIFEGQKENINIYLDLLKEGVPNGFLPILQHHPLDLYLNEVLIVNFLCMFIKKETLLTSNGYSLPLGNTGAYINHSTFEKKEYDSLEAGELFLTNVRFIFKNDSFSFDMPLIDIISIDFTYDTIKIFLHSSQTFIFITPTEHFKSVYNILKGSNKLFTMYDRILIFDSDAYKNSLTKKS